MAQLKPYNLLHS